MTGHRCTGRGLVSDPTDSVQSTCDAANLKSQGAAKLNATKFVEGGHG